MSSYGIYTLANDPVYDQLVALLNSIEANVGTSIPISVIPYNNQLDKVKKEIESRKQVTLFDNQESLKKWDDFINEIWTFHPRATRSKFSYPGWYKGFVHRKFAAFDGDSDKFVFFDADSLAMKPLDDVFKKLEIYDLVFNDWEHTKRELSPELDVAKIASETGWNQEKIYPKLHCDSFFGGRKGLFDAEVLGDIKDKLTEQKEVAWVQDRCWWSTSALFSYMTLKVNYSIFNYTQSENPAERTGNCADADPFVDIDNVLYNEQGLKPIQRIHYMNYSSEDFRGLCQGVDANIRYKDIFLYYRFMKNLEEKPNQLIPPSKLDKVKRHFKRLKRKIELAFG